MQFKANQTVLHGRARFEKGDPVPENLAHYFAANGWADAVDDEAKASLSELRGDAPPKDVTLNIDSSTIGVSSPEVGNG
jgi:hypothetical protein